MTRRPLAGGIVLLAMLAVLALVQTFRGGETGYSLGQFHACPTPAPGTPTSTNTPGGPTKTPTVTKIPCKATFTPTPCPPDYEVGPEGNCVLGTAPGFPTHRPTPGACPPGYTLVGDGCKKWPLTPIACPNGLAYDPFVQGCVSACIVLHCTPTPCPIHELPDPDGDGCMKVTQTMTPTPIPCPTDMVYDPYIHGCVPITPTSTPCPTDTAPNPFGPGCATITATPCPTGKVPNTFGGSGCGTPTPTPTSQRPYGAHVTLVNHYPRPAVFGQKKTWVFEIENTGSQFGCEPHEVMLKVQLTGQDTKAFYSSAMLGCHETDQITASSIVTAPPGSTISASAHASAGAAQGNTIEVSDIVGLLGDFNCDAAIDSIDAALILQIEAGMAVPLPCTGDGDVNHDGELDSLDALLILQYNAGLIGAFS